MNGWNEGANEGVRGERTGRDELGGQLVRFKEFIFVPLISCVTAVADLTAAARECYVRKSWKYEMK